MFCAVHGKLCLYTFFYDSPWGREPTLFVFSELKPLKKGNFFVWSHLLYALMWNLDGFQISTWSILYLVNQKHSSTLLRVCQQRGRSCSLSTESGAHIECTQYKLLEGVGQSVCLYTFFLARTNSKSACTVVAGLCALCTQHHCTLCLLGNISINIRAPLIYKYCVLCQYTHTGSCTMYGFEFWCQNLSNNVISLSR